MQRIGQIALPVAATVIVVLALSVGVTASPGGFPGFTIDGSDDLKAGPLGLNRQAVEGEVPVAIQIPDATVDAEVELNQIVDGVMQDPSGPWVVSWYEETAKAGDDSNAVMSGHVDYWDVGPAVFYTVGQLQAGSPIEVAGDDGSVYTYEVEWVDTFALAELTPETITDLVGPTDYPALTLITCGGDFDRAAGEYLSRTIVRGRLVDTEDAGQADDEAADDQGASGALGANTTAAVVEDGLNMRADPSTDGDVVTKLNSGDEVTITGEAVEAEGYVWWPVETADGETGWVVEDFLEATG
ncbi:MAG: SH3 domain-containing protein [Chloroflexia bacterium]|nr:SH3 domain-containing protein [Chloroflexia bacterium]